MKHLLLVITSVFTLGSIALMLLSYLENPKSEFDNYSAMEKSGLIERGWISKFIPKSAYLIKESHNIDTNTVRMHFKYDVADGGTLKDICTLLSETEKGWKYVCPPYQGGTSIITLRRDGTAYYWLYSDGLNY